MKRGRIIRAIAAALLAVFGSVAVTLPAHLTSPVHQSGDCTAASPGDLGCLFLQFLSETFDEGQGTPEPVAPVTYSLILESRTDATLSLIVTALPSLRAPPFSFHI